MRSAIVRLAGPMAVGIVAIFMMNLVDAWFVSKLGPAQLAAMSFTFPVTAFFGSLSIGLGVGASSVISRAIGGDQEERVKRLTTDALLLSVAIVAVLSAVGFATIDPLFRALGASPELLPLITEYMGVWYLGMAFLTVPMVGNAAIRATGDARTPAAIMVTAALINMAVDPLLIFGIGPFPRMGIQGAAVATVVSRTTTMLGALWVLHRRERMLSLVRPRLAAVVQSWREILWVGGPAAATNVVAPLTNGIITGLVATYGEHAVAGFGAAGRVELMAMVVIFALGSALGPFVGQNWGAGERRRVGQAVRLVQWWTVIWGAVAWALLLVFARPLAAQFAADPAIQDVIVMFFWFASPGMLFVGLLISSGTAFNAIRLPLRASALNLLRTPVLSISLAWLGSLWWGLPGVFGGLTLSVAVAGLAGAVWTAPLRQGRDIR